MTDPTLQSSGQLRIYLKDATNLTRLSNAPTIDSPGLFASIPPAALTYGPPEQPPPAWTDGQQYVTNQGNLYGFGTQVALGVLPNQSFGAGLFKAVTIMDMSSQSVVPGGQYIFTVFPQWSTFNSPGDSNVQIYFKVMGGSDGSTVLPGFGLFNLSTNPNGWTYVVPKEFTGDWEIGVLDWLFQSALWLSVEYSPPRDHGNGLVASLVFTISGATDTTNFDQPSSALARQPDESPKSLIRFLHPRSQPHVLVPGALARAEKVPGT